MELDLINIMLWGFGTTIVLLLIFVSVLAGFLIRYVGKENKKEKHF
jgi:hypothetical protein